MLRTEMARDVEGKIEQQFEGTYTGRHTEMLQAREIKLCIESDKLGERRKRKVMWR